MTDRIRNVATGIEYRVADEDAPGTISKQGAEALLAQRDEDGKRLWEKVK
jgi:hypothetical protein